jgi:hypothetical protein
MDCALARLLALPSSFEFWLTLLMCVLGGTSLFADGPTPLDPGQGGKGPSSETKTLSFLAIVSFGCGVDCRH